ncbi:hypothetical protein [Actinoplanes friuliensis]|jgi:hypothetical protein|uniref:Uncharacterized protein n=1 Tax=Actinoplanes friuliensis DSM 7358 TaxID=1246995 RepID=U5W722_9ACTN|nr:hypothetical protein [Actinoplanes friuliensis]AGZ43785.1 hypothetical protein AFR_27620 [Actinoplanes friuliensis DSM 7358]
MAGSTASTASSRWTGLLMWLLPPLFELPVVVALCSGVPEVAREAVFGAPGTQVVVLLAFVASVGGFVAAARGTSGLVQAGIAGILAIAAGVVAALGAGFLTGGGFLVLGLLLVHSAVSIAMLARATLRRTTP